VSQPEQIDRISDPPWHRSSWTGQLVSLDGAATDDFTKDDVAAVIAHGSTPTNDWDGSAAAIVQLKDGRYAAWETWWDCTGSGFSCDAYGGTADIMFALTVQAATEALSEKARELLQWSSPQRKP
jgi:hypothetical protein